MRKGIRPVIFLMIMLFSLAAAGSIRAAEQGMVSDGASLLSESDAGELGREAGELMEATGWSIFLVTTADAGGKTAVDYADDFFDAHSPEQENGVALLIDMDNREIVISTSGEAARYLTDERTENIIDDAYGYVSGGDYRSCFEQMLSGIRGCYAEGILQGQYNYDQETGKRSEYRSIRPAELVIAAVAACGAGAVFFSVIVGKYRMKTGTYSYAFRDYGRVELRVKEDRYAGQTVTHRRIPRQSSGDGDSAGRSTMHTSGSGRQHGGGSRKF